MEKEKKDSKLIVYIYIVIIYMLMLQAVLEKYMPLFSYLDESLAVIGICIGFIALIKNNFKIQKSNFIILFCLLIISILGFCSIFIYKYQNLKGAVVDCFLLVKFFSVYFLSYIIFKKFDIFKYSTLVEKNVKFMIIALFILTILNYIFNIYPTSERYGIRSNQLFYGYPTYLAAVCISLMSLNIAFSKRIDNIYIGMIIIMLISTLRMKAIVAATVSLIIIIYVTKTKKKISFSKLGIIALLGFVMAYQQIQFYFLNTNDFARKELLTTSVEIANNYFPLGTGFGTFASFESTVNYSPVYKIYHINNIYGLEEGKAYFACDSFWPMILGQFGYIGCLLYVVCIFMLYKKVQMDYKRNDKMYIAKLICLVYLLIASTAESAFVNPMAIPMALILGM